jgi:hypothetical protein
VWQQQQCGNSSNKYCQHQTTGTRSSGDSTAKLLNELTAITWQQQQDSSSKTAAADMKRQHQTINESCRSKNTTADQQR